MTYEEIQEKVSAFGDKPCPLSSVNEDGETVIIEEGENEGEHYYRLTTVQKNDWLRINYFYADGSTEELYEK